MRSALQLLKSYFEGDGNKGSRAVYGAEDTRAWYWFLVLQSGNQQKADQIMGDLFHELVGMPYSVKYINPPELSTVNVAQVYMYLAAYYSGTGNYIRSQKYGALAKIVDPK